MNSANSETNLTTSEPILFPFPPNTSLEQKISDAITSVESSSSIVQDDTPTVVIELKEFNETTFSTIHPQQEQSSTETSPSQPVTQQPTFPPKPSTRKSIVKQPWFLALKTFLTSIYPLENMVYWTQFFIRSEQFCYHKVKQSNLIWLKRFGFAILLCWIVLLDFFQIELRSIAQISFAGNPISGYIIFCGLVYANPWAAINSIWCSSIGNLTAILLGLNESLIRNGLYGFNSGLIGIGLTVFTGTALYDFRMWYPLAMLSIFSIFLQEALQNLCRFVPIFQPAAFPFVICNLIYLAASQGFYFFPINRTLLMPTLLVNPISSVGEYTLLQIVLSVLTGFSNVYFQENWVAGLLFFLAHCWNHPFFAFVMLYSSIIGILVGLSFGAQLPLIYAGLYSFNSIIAGMGIFFIFKRSFATFLLSIAAAWMSALFQAGFLSIFSVVGLPTFATAAGVVLNIFSGIFDSSKWFHHLKVTK